MKLYCGALVLCTISIMAMELDPKQIELCAGRRAYIQGQRNNPPKVCVFCDEAVLAQNYIVQEDKENDVRIMMNKNPYFPFAQGHHLLIMPLSHKELSTDFSKKELVQQVAAAHVLSAKLYPDSYSQEYFTNWGKLAGQSVPHWHNQLKIYTQPACSLPERIKLSQSAQINNIQDAFELVKSKLASSQAELLPFEGHSPIDPIDCFCDCCLVFSKPEKDKENLVLGRFEHNLVCMTPYPHTVAEIAVVPYKHVAALTFLSPEELTENMVLAMALLPKVKEYAETNIRDCDGGNLYTKSLGATDSKLQKYHLHTLVMPRTTIAPTPGTLEANSCKLDFDPLHFFTEFKAFCDTLQSESKI
jgi:diadenosine tetraphosphate (Ap4A) HIT family hydrolase